MQCENIKSKEGISKTALNIIESLSCLAWVDSHNTTMYTSLNHIRLKAPPPPPPTPSNFWAHAFNFGATLFCVGDISQKYSFKPCGKKEILIVGQDLAVRGASKCKVDVIFIIFREFNIIMLDIIDLCSFTI